MKKVGKNKKFVFTIIIILYCPHKIIVLDIIQFYNI